MAEFILWLAERRGVPAVSGVLLLHPVGEPITKQVFKLPSDDAEVRERARRIALLGLEHFPDLADELRKEAQEEGLKEGLKKGVKKGLAPLVRQFSRRLGRELSADEQRMLARRLKTHGADRLGDVVLDLTSAQLAAWLADPDAK